MEYEEEEYLLMSGIQHFSICRRQWALIHTEGQWEENILTARGRLEHERCHDSSVKEKRGSLFTVRGMRVVSHRLRLIGNCDVVEFRRDKNGVGIVGKDGLWLPMPVEYKHGTPSQNDADRLQLCAQAMALEEMMVCDIPEACLFYEKIKRREIVELTAELREKAVKTAQEMHDYASRGHTPKAKPKKECRGCSMRNICLPQLEARTDVNAYIYSHVEEYQ